MQLYTIYAAETEVKISSYGLNEKASFTVEKLKCVAQ